MSETIREEKQKRLMWPLKIINKYIIYEYRL